MEEGNIEPKKKKKKGTPRETLDIVPLPLNVDKIKEVIRNLNLEHFKVLNRLTVSFSNQETLHKIVSKCNKCFDNFIIFSDKINCFISQLL